jgi:hypothetical protein
MNKILNIIRKFDIVLILLIASLLSEPPKSFILLIPYIILITIAVICMGIKAHDTIKEIFKKK